MAGRRIFGLLSALALISASLSGIAGNKQASLSTIDSVDDEAIREAMDQLGLSIVDIKEQINRSLSWTDEKDVRNRALEAVDEGELGTAVTVMAQIDELEVHLYCSESGMTPRLRTWVWGIPQAMECEDQQSGFPPEETLSDHDSQADAYINIVPSEINLCAPGDQFRGDRLDRLGLEMSVVADPDDRGGDQLLLGLGYPWSNSVNPTITIDGIDQGEGVDAGESAELSATFDDLCGTKRFSGDIDLTFIRGSLSPTERIRYTHGTYGGESTYGELVSDGSNENVFLEVGAHDRSTGDSYGSWSDWGITFLEVEGDFLKVVGEVDTADGEVTFRGCDIGVYVDGCDRLGDTITPLTFDYREVRKTDGGGRAHQLELGFGAAQPTFELKGAVEGSSNSFSYVIEGFPETAVLRYDSGDDDNGFASVDLTKQYSRYDGHFGWLSLSGTMDDGQKKIDLEAGEVERFRFGFGDDDGAPHGPSSDDNLRVTELTVNHANDAGYARAHGEDGTTGSSFTQWLSEVESDSEFYDWAYNVMGVPGSSLELDGRNKTAEIDPPGVEGIFLTFLGSTDPSAYGSSSAWLDFYEIDDSDGEWPCVYHVPVSISEPGGSTCA